MTEALEIVAGLLGGAALIAGALYVAVRPYLAIKPAEPWLPDRSGKQDSTIGTGLDGLN